MIAMIMMMSKKGKWKMEKGKRKKENEIMK